MSDGPIAFVGSTVPAGSILSFLRVAKAPAKTLGPEEAHPSATIPLSFTSIAAYDDSVFTAISSASIIPASRNVGKLTPSADNLAQKPDV